MENNKANKNMMPPCMQMTNAGMEVSMKDIHKLEKYYPRIYHVIMPVIEHYCDKMEEKHGKDHIPCKKEIEDMLEDIMKDIKDDIDDDDDDDCDEEDKDVKEYKHKGEEYMDMSRQRRPPRYRRRRYLNDLLGIMLINELVGRRRPFYPPYGPYPPYPGYYGAPYPGY